MSVPNPEKEIQIATEFTLDEDRCEVVCSGPFQRGDVLKLIDSLRARMERLPEVKKCLVDVREAQITLGIMGEYVIGEHAAKSLAGLRVALIQAPGQVKKLLEDTAYNRGLRILIVTGRDEALVWLNK
jgi:hypothetical protein